MDNQRNPQEAHPSYTRLLQAAFEIKQLRFASHVGQRLAVSPGTMHQWKRRGVASAHLNDIKRIIGVRPEWLMDHEGEMREPVGGGVSLTPMQERLLILSGKLGPKTLAAYVGIGEALAEQPEVIARHYAGPDRRKQDAACMQKRRNSDSTEQAAA